MIKKTTLILGLLALCFLFSASVEAQSVIEIKEQSIESDFRKHITASLNASSPEEISQVEFYYRVVGQRATSKNVADFEPGTDVEAEYRINQSSIYFPPGAELEYWWKVTDSAGNTLKTEPESYLYLDNRYDFKTLSNDRITLYWYNGRGGFGEALFEQANAGLDQLEQDIGISLERPIKIFIYGSHEDLLNALSVSAQEWTGGVAYAEHGVVVMGVAPQSLEWGLKATLHEMTHLVIHQATDNPYGDLPRWLDEGIAVYNEDPERLDSQFRHSFSAAVASDSLMSLQTLSSTFPADPEAANLAYGESGAVVKFIIDTYGAEAMKHLLEIFSEGALYDDALEEALGVDMRGLDNAWRESLNLPPLPDGSQTEPAPSAIETAPEIEPETQTEPAPTEPLQEQPETQTVTQADTPKTDESGGGLGCLPGLVPLFALGLVFVSRQKKLF